MDSRRMIKIKMTKKIKLKYVFTFLFCFYLLLAIDCQLSTALATVNGDSSELSSKPQWIYIVVHHSATTNGNAHIFEMYHFRKGMQNGLAYHFVIDNGTCGKRDGQLEIGHRWKEQLPGGHCKQQWVNDSGIGICLVGNFNRTRPTSRQMRTLVSLVNYLRKKYNIAVKYVVGHGKIKGEKTQCPGKYFPWRDFYSDLQGTD